jgi:hypothetical protein
MKLLFEEAAHKCYQPAPARIGKLKDWIKEAEAARAKDNLEPKSNQYDKAEELITYYTFAPLFLSPNAVGLTNRILRIANVSPHEEGVSTKGLERQFPSPEGYTEWLKKRLDKHPVGYIRKQSQLHIKNSQRLEAPTHVDAFIETDKLLILFEIKFTSDISYDTTFNPTRNQLARLIDVGLEATKLNRKQVLVILSTPAEFYENRSRLYYYKIQEYTDPLKIKEDIGWRTVSEIKDSLLGVRWVDLKELISVLYTDFNHKDTQEAMEFFKERNLA